MAGLTDTELADLVSSISYGKGYVLKQDGRILHWEHKGADNFGRYDDVTVIWQNFEIGYHFTREAALRLIFFYLAYAEDHEMRERFRVRGKAVYNPHRHGAQMTIRHGGLCDAIAEAPAELSIEFYGDNLR
jgi:hypothetical protein